MKYHILDSDHSDKCIGFTVMYLFGIHILIYFIITRLINIYILLFFSYTIDRLSLILNCTFLNIIICRHTYLHISIFNWLQDIVYNILVLISNFKIIIINWLINIHILMKIIWSFLKWMVTVHIIFIRIISIWYYFDLNSQSITNHIITECLQYTNEISSLNLPDILDAALGSNVYVHHHIHFKI